MSFELHINSPAESIPITRPTLPSLVEYQHRLKKLWETRQITNGTLVREAESLLEGYIGDTHCVALANCTLGLVLSLKALGLRGSVLLPSFTFFATAHSVIWNGLEPVFIDVDEQTWNLAPSALEEVLNRRQDVSAILGVHVFGNPCRVEELEALAGKYDVKLVFDSAHALGSICDGRKAGGFGDVEVFSLSPTKPAVAAEGGVVSTRDEELAELLCCARDYGNSGDYNPSFIGLNARLSELHAAMALGSIAMLETNVRLRNEAVSRYINSLGMIPGIKFQRVRESDRSTYKDFTILIEQTEFGMSRDALSWWLERQGIDNRKYYFPPVHRTAAYWDRWGMARDEELPVTNMISKQVLSLPIWSDMEAEVVDLVCGAVLAAHDRAEEISAGYMKSLSG